MGLLVDGEWRQQWYDTASSGGRFVRAQSSYRNWITPDGSAGPTGEPGFTAEPGRYHLYVSLACPWAHRALIIRKLKRLEEMISVSVVHWRMLDNGWTFEDGPGVVPDPIHAANYLYQVYQAADPGYTGRVTVPLLWDRRGETIVNNESADILRMLGSAFDEVGAAPGDFYPQDLRTDIDELNARIYDSVNNGVYRSGFATTQAAYEEAVIPLFETLEWIEQRLERSRYLLGERLTEADIRLFTTLVRFDPVYHGHFKCNLRQIASSPNLWGFTRDIYQLPGVSDTVNFEHIKRHYYESHKTINPTGVVPIGPTLDFHAPSGRGA